MAARSTPILRLLYWMRSFAPLVFFCLISAFAQDLSFPDSRSLTWRAQELEEAGKTTEAWLLYTQAARIDPKNSLAAGKATQLRTKALAGANLISGKETPVEPDANDPLIHISEAELREAPRLLPPPSLAPSTNKITLTLTGDAKTIYTRLLQHFGIEVLFDGEYDNPQNRQVQLEDASFDEALYLAGVATNSFVNPLSPQLAMVIRDTDQKRRDQERNVAIILPMPTTISAPEAQELARAIQQIFELQRVSIDSVRGMMLIRDRWSKVKPAELALSQLLSYRGQVMVEVEFYEVSDQSTLSFGFSLPTQSQLIPLVKRPNLTPAIVNGFTNAMTFGGGATLFGLGVTSAKLFASMTHSNTRSIYTTQLRSLDGLAATVHIGDRYPIITATANFLDTGAGSTPGNTQVAAPQIQFEDLGLTIKLTPHMHANGEISMELDSEFKVLTGQTNNNIPVIANRKYTGTVRLKAGEWAVAAGLVTRSVSPNVSGLNGVSQIPVLGPLLSSSGNSKSFGQTLLVVRPYVIGAVPAENPLREIFTGSESRFPAPTR
ncbi:type II secretion system protein GspD [Bryobacter aggregatus]|uniref:type II secretion system protein GspD n=1 Tax=Bryobacter aggregatus TaxID=360054 RepID=UPI0004E22EF2|nr:type II and III secretion system protein [Bryobacter aggregatus]